MLILVTVFENQPKSLILAKIPMSPKSLKIHNFPVKLKGEGYNVKFFHNTYETLLDYFQTLCCMFTLVKMFILRSSL